MKQYQECRYQVGIIIVLLSYHSRSLAREWHKHSTRMTRAWNDKDKGVHL